MMTFDIILKARYFIMQDGSTMMIDSSMIKKIVSVAVGVNQIDLHVIGKHNVKDKQRILLIVRLGVCLILRDVTSYHSP